MRRALRKSKPQDQMERIRRVVPEASVNESELIRDALAISMTSVERLWALLKAVDYLEDHEIDGAFVECGVWKGGSSFLMAKRLAERNSFSRSIWLYDTFEGMVEPGTEDIRSNGATAAEMLLREDSRKDESLIWAIANEQEVRSNMEASGYDSSRFRFVKGDVCETLRENLPEKIALLRLDTDWYESTRCELELLMPRMAKGGIVIIDDYGDWQGSKKAVDEYLGRMTNPPLVHRIDYTGRSWTVTS